MTNPTKKLPLTLLPQAPGLRPEAVVIGGETITLSVAVTQVRAHCPLCGQETARIHSRYRRTLADLPWGRFAVRVDLHVRRFRCPAAACPRAIFTERLPRLAAPYARRTARLDEVLQLVGLALGGEAGARLSSRLGMEVSPATLLRGVRRLPPTEAPRPRGVGVDDWALRKGQTYGTILVDLERRQVVDRLPDRTAETWASWLAEHPEVTLVSRDRAGASADGARRGAPQAVHVADRWHLLKNLTEALESVLERHRASLRQVAEQAAKSSTGAAPTRPAGEAVRTEPPLVGRSRAAEASRVRRAARQERSAQVVALRAQGLDARTIAHQVGISRRTVFRCLGAGSFPERKPRRRGPSLLADSQASLHQRWEAGCHNAAQLWREICAQGFTGSQRSIYSYLPQLRRGPAPPTDAAPDHQPPALVRAAPQASLQSPRQAVWLLVRRPEDLDAEEQADLETLTQMVRERQPEALDPWLATARESALPELRRFAAGITRDKDAVLGALNSSWSNGQTEGQVNRLKMLKRQMFGRAKFDLLRQRVLRAS